jgi:hypothetical protein
VVPCPEVLVRRRTQYGRRLAPPDMLWAIPWRPRGICTPRSPHWQRVRRSAEPPTVASLMAKNTVECFRRVLERQRSTQAKMKRVAVLRALERQTRRPRMDKK